jgi:capsular exopolysaccharide synthesis family protein
MSNANNGLNHNQNSGSARNSGKLNSPAGYPNSKNVYNREEQADTDEIDLKYLFNVLMRYKVTAMVIIVLAVGIAAVYAYSLPAVYESSGTLLIQEERNQYTWAGSDLSSILTSSFGVGAASRLVNEVQILESRRVSDEMAERLIEQKTMRNGEVFPILWYAYPEDSTIVGKETVSSRVQGRMSIEQTDEEADILQITFSSPSPFEAAHLVNLTMDTYSDVSAQQKRLAATQALNFLEEEREQARRELTNSEEELRNYMSRTNLVQIDGQTQAAIDRLAELESQRQQVQVERVSVNSSIESYESQLEQIRPGLAEQLSENISGQLERAQFRLAELRTERDLLIQRNPSLRQNPEQEPQYANLVDEIETVRNQIRDITNNVLNADDSDVYIGFLDEEDGGVTQRIIELRRNLIELKIQQSQLNAQQDVLDERIEEENAFLDDLPDNMIDLARLRRDTQVNEELFSVISQQFTQTQLWEQTQYGAGRPIDRAMVPQAPAGPKRNLIILIGFMLGGVFSLAFVVGKETINRSVDGVEKLNNTGFPVLASVPDTAPYIKNKFSGKETTNVQDKSVSTSWSVVVDSISPLAESYRRLQRNIIYADPDKTFNTIVVTSSKKAEGKSTISINLAAALAESGKKVILVDTDFRRPVSYSLTGEEREMGIVDLFFKGKKFSEVVKHTVAQNLDLLTSGEQIQNPSSLLESDKMEKLLEHLQARYDHIVIDTAPYGVITDAAALMKKADAVVLTTRFKETKLNELFHTIEGLKRIHANIIGYVITGYQHKKSADYYYTDYTYDSYQAYEEYHEKV